jgi:hypothetical protein
MKLVEHKKVSHGSNSINCILLKSNCCNIQTPTHHSTKNRYITVKIYIWL